MSKEDQEMDFEWEERNDLVPFKAHMIAGSIAGISEHTIILPLDNMKTHIQTTGASTRQVFKTIKTTGYKNFYQGAGIISMGCIPSHALFFSCYEITKKYFTKENKIDILGNALVGGISVISHDLIMTPCELVKQRMQLLKSSSAISVIKDFKKQYGYRGFWRSFPVNFVQNLPHSMVTVSANETFKTCYRRWVGEHFMASYFLCGSLAGCVTALVTSPLDNIKTRLNCENIEHSSLKHLKEQGNYNRKLQSEYTKLKPQVQRAYVTEMIKQIECVCSVSEKKMSKLFNNNKLPKSFCAAKKIYSEVGFKGFFRGLGLRMFIQSSSTAVSWTIYEMSKKFLIYRNVR